VTGPARSGAGVWTAARVIADDRDYAPGHVIVRGGRVEAVEAGYASGAAHAFPRGTLAPGFVDLQVNGCAGVDFLDADAEDVSRAARFLASTGTTAFLPTIISSPLPRARAALDAIRAAKAAQGPDAARIVGVHLEGPALNPARRGAHEAANLRAPGDADVAALVAAAGPMLALFTLAPELPGARALARSLRAAGVVVALGHSDAEYDVARDAFVEDVQMVTHLFNAMRGIHHRSPGPIAAAALDARCVVGVIADGAHVHAALAALTFRWFGADRVCLVTDATAAAGMPPGAFALGGRRVHKAAGDAPRLPDGTLAGSALRLDEAVANLASWGVPLRDAALAAARTPANVIGLRDRGRIAPGARADLCVLDETLQCRCTVIEGEIAWSRP
jgi:N-acetylglucosamine-6-phosphate deacetylase